MENRERGAGGWVPPLADLRAMAEFTRTTLKLPIHLDGARLWNAAVALGVTGRELAGPADSVTFCLSKGLACPVGSVVVGDAAKILKELEGFGKIEIYQKEPRP